MVEADGISPELWNDVMKVKDYPKKAKIWYIHEVKHGAKILRGAVVQNPDGHLGYAWVHKNDLHKASKKRTRAIAFARAAKCDVYKFLKDWYRERNGFRTHIPREVYPYLDMLEGGLI
jgi:hypothetical protein